MKETSKCEQSRREAGEYEQYFIKKGLEIGGGDDPLKCESAIIEQRDISSGKDGKDLSDIESNKFYFLYSSHCLEHIEDIKKALSEWIRVVKPGGVLYIVVPDYELYEHKVFPSKYNADHKWAFSLKDWKGQKKVKNVKRLFGKRKEVDIIKIRLNDANYDYSLSTDIDQTRGNACAQIEIILQKKLT